MKIDLENKKYLVTSGCSFTDGFNMRKYGSWAYYLSEMMHLELHNQARGGSGNEYISDSIICYLFNNDEIRNNCIVGVAWSDVSRLMSPIHDGTYNILDTIQPQDFISTPYGDGKYIKYSCAKIFFSDIIFTVYKTYMAIISLNSFLERYNIPYFYIDAINPNKVNIINDGNTIQIINHWNSNSIQFDFNDWPHQYKYIINNNNNNKLFNNFLKINGYKTISQFMFSDYEKYQNGNPGHPNDVASIEIAKSIFNQIV